MQLPCSLFQANWLIDYRFHGVMSRELSEEILRQGGMQEGLYLVRESPNSPGQYVVSLVSEGMVSEEELEGAGKKSASGMKATDDYRIIFGKL